MTIESLPTNIMASSILQQRSRNNHPHINYNNSPFTHIIAKHTFSVLLLVVLIVNEHTALPSLAAATSLDTGSTPSRNGSNTSNSFLLSSGLINLGNTCYLNAQLQCVYHIPYLRNAILHPEKYSSAKTKECNDTPNTGLRGLQAVFTSMKQTSTNQHTNTKPKPTQRQNSHPPVSTQPLLTSLEINPYLQQDSHEFFTLLHPALSHPPLTDLYRGHSTSYIAALDGSQRERSRVEPFLDLSLDVSNYRSVRESLMEGMFTGAEVLSVEEGNGWRPPPLNSGGKGGKVEEKVDALKGMTLGVGGLPVVLQLHLMRFSYDWETGSMDKLNCRFIFPKELDLSTVCNDAADEKDPSRVMYELQSVLIHVGGYESGHYYSYVRPDIRRNLWYRYDDDRVTQVSFKDVREDAFGGKKRRRSVDETGERRVGFWGRLFQSNGGGGGGFGYGGQRSSAYMLQYVRKSDIPMLYD